MPVPFVSAHVAGAPKRIPTIFDRVMNVAPQSNEDAAGGRVMAIGDEVG
ncbi:hypothetical protein QA634_19375 [Methylobacterium sp. CB376]|nr:MULTISPECIES: hypothetical protein [Methylobacterium]WFT77493.1 hypothetical protein QA634_19375 [Methylobacterium nodulans]